MPFPLSPRAAGAALVAALVALGPAWPARAHPHVWITSVITIVFADGAVTALRHRWTFDEFFSSWIVEEHDANGDGALDADESAAVRDNAFAGLEEYSHFTHLKVAGAMVPLREFEEFRASVEAGVLAYEFTLPLPTPVDPRTTEFAVGVYDPEYYIEVLLDEQDPVRFAGLPDGACIYAVRDHLLPPIYYGLVQPLAITLECATG